MRARRPIAPLVSWSAAAYFLALPLFDPRGRYVWGHYAGRDLLLGVVSLLVALAVSTIAGTAPGSRMRRTCLNLTTALCTTVVAAMVCDASYVFGVRKIWRANTTDMWLDLATPDVLPDDVLGFVRKPGSAWSGLVVAGGRYVEYRTDEHGFRNPPGLDRADVVFIGDSFTEAGPMPEEDTFVHRVAVASGLRTVNLGRSHYGAQQEEIVLERYGLAYRPRAVVWLLFEGNDLADAHRFAEWQRNPAGAQSTMQRYVNASPILTGLRMTIPANRDRPRRLRLPDGRTQDVHLDYRYVPEAPARDALGLHETTRALRAGMELCRAHDVALLIVLVPIKVRVLAPWIVFDDDADRERFLPGGRETSGHDFAHVVGDAARALGLPVIDAFPLLRERAVVDDRFVFATYADSHLEIDGHAALADAIVAWLAGEEHGAEAAARLRTAADD